MKKKKREFCWKRTKEGKQRKTEKERGKRRKDGGTDGDLNEETLQYFRKEVIIQYIDGNAKIPGIDDIEIKDKQNKMLERDEEEKYFYS